MSESLEERFERVSREAYAMRMEAVRLKALLDAEERDAHQSDDDNDDVGDDEKEEEEDEGVRSRLCVVLCRPTGPVNLGQICRLCTNLGVRDLRLVEPLCTVNCSESRKFAKGAKQLLLSAPVHSSLADAVADCGIVMGTSGVARAAEAIGPRAVCGVLRRRPVERAALVFGNESEGLSAEEMKLCSYVIRLPTPGSNPSYNLGHAVAITLFTVLTHRNDDDDDDDEDEAVVGKAVNQATLTHMQQRVMAVGRRIGLDDRDDDLLRAQLPRTHVTAAIAGAVIKFTKRLERHLDGLEQQ